VNQSRRGFLARLLGIAVGGGAAAAAPQVIALCADQVGKSTAMGMAYGGCMTTHNPWSDQRLMAALADARARMDEDIAIARVQKHFAPIPYPLNYRELGKI